MLMHNATMHTRFITILFAIAFLAIIWNCKKESKEQVCNEVIHFIKPPIFTAEQEKIIDKYRDIIYSKLLQPHKYYIDSVKERPDKTYVIELAELSYLRSHTSTYKSDPCFSLLGGLDGDVWFILNEFGEIIESRAFKRGVFK